MAKTKITESRLNAIIANSINEALEDEGLGHFLGNAYQWGRNQAANFKRDFNAGRNNRRWLDKDYDEFKKYGKDADNIRNFGGDGFANYRYQTIANRKKEAPNQWELENGTFVNGNRENHGLVQQTPPQGGQDNMQQTSPQGAQQTPPQGGQGGAQPNTTPSFKTFNKDSYMAPAELSKANETTVVRYLVGKGFNWDKYNQRWLYADGKSYADASGYDDIKTAAQRYKQLMNSRLNENKRMNKIISESVDKAIRNALGNKRK